MHDPLYDTPERGEKWLIALAAVIAGLIIACVIFAGASPEQKQEPAPPALQETRTQVETGRMICQRWSDKGCAEWRLYRTTSY